MMHWLLLLLLLLQQMLMIPKEAPWEVTRVENSILAGFSSSLPDFQVVCKHCGCNKLVLLYELALFWNHEIVIVTTTCIRSSMIAQVNASWVKVWLGGPTRNVTFSIFWTHPTSEKYRKYLKKGFQWVGVHESHLWLQQSQDLSRKNLHTLTAAVKEGWVADDSLLHVTANTLGVSRFQRKISCRKQAAIMTTTKTPQTAIEKQAPGWTNKMRGTGLSLKNISYGMPSEISYCRTTNFFRIPCGTIKKNLNFPYANTKWLVWQQQENTIFHNEKIRIKHWNIGPTIHLESFPCVC